MHNLKEIQTKLKHKMTSLMTSSGNEGFRYQEVFGCKESQSFNSPHVLVRVELRLVDPWKGSSRYKYYVFVDFHLPLRADIEDAERFVGFAESALKKAQWVQKIIDGPEWNIDELR